LILLIKWHVLIKKSTPILKCLLLKGFALVGKKSPQYQVLPNPPLVFTSKTGVKNCWTLKSTLAKGISRISTDDQVFLIVSQSFILHVFVVFFQKYLWGDL